MEGGLQKFIVEEPLDFRLEDFAERIANREGIVAAYQAAIDPRVSEEIAEERGIDLIRRNQFVAEKIREKQHDARILKKLTKADIAVSLKKIYDVSILDYFTVSCGNWKIKEPALWTNDMKMACVGIKPTRFGMEIKIIDKLGLMNTICSLMGLNETTQNINVHNKYGDMSIDDLKKMAEDGGYVEFMEE